MAEQLVIRPAFASYLGAIERRAPGTIFDKPQIIIDLPQKLFRPPQCAQQTVADYV
jgi:hypothetical protein